MCLAAAVATLKVLEEEKLVDNSKAMGKVMAKLHQDLKNKHPSVGDVRSIGLFGAIELVKNRKTKEPLVPFNGANPIMAKTIAYLKDHGLYCFSWNNLIFTVPPLCINETQLKEAFAIIDEGLKIADTAYLG
jgi:taurine--2-oxoglutarate transaminase